MAGSISGKLRGSIALVTGASRGIGRGIALELGAAGATVYLTARSIDKQLGSMPGTAAEVAEEISQLGGKGIAIGCDHNDDRQVAAVLDRITRESGRLNVLVNNVYNNSFSAAGPSFEGGHRFWEAPLAAWDDTMSVGLRSHFVATSLAMPLLIEGNGLVVNISSCGAYSYFYSVHYGVQKAGVDRMVRDMAYESRDLPVTFVALWPGFVDTELSQLATAMGHDGVKGAAEMTARLAAEAEEEITPDQRTAMKIESPFLSGRAVVALATDPDIREKSGRTLSVVGVAEEYGHSDVDGSLPDAFAFRNLGVWKPLAA